jgi:hypothetical protein
MLYENLVSEEVREGILPLAQESAGITYSCFYGDATRRSLGDR